MGDRVETTCSRCGEEIVVLLCGGDKSSQVSDIRAAKKLAVELEN